MSRKSSAKPKSGAKVYEVEYVRDNKKYEMHIAEDGKVLKKKAD